jgi:hypothetical protein
MLLELLWAQLQYVHQESATRRTHRKFRHKHLVYGQSLLKRRDLVFFAEFKP